MRLLCCLLLLLVALPAPAQDAAAPRFAVLEFVVEGNTRLPASAIEKAVMPHMGPDRSLDDVERARAALEKAYQAAGFLSVLVDIPEQAVTTGEVRLRVTEGRVERLAVTGSRYYDQGVIRERVPELAAGQVPDFNRVQAQVAAASRDELQIQSVLKPGALPGTLDVELQVKDRLPLVATLELNNHHAPDTDPWRLVGTLRYGNLWQRDHSLSLTLQTAPRETQQSQVLVASYTAPLGRDWLLAGYAVWSDSLVEPVGASVLGEGFTLGLRAQRAFALDSSSHTLSFGADFKDLKERLSFGDGSLSTPLRYLPFQLGWQAAWSAGRSLTTLNMAWTWAWRGLLQRDVECPGDIGPVDQFACKRQGGDGGFSHLRADLRHRGPAPWDLGGTWSWRLQGQLGSQPLVSAEQFAIGGAESVRGYLEAEGSGDRGLQGSFEWRSPNLLGPAAAGDWLQDLALLGFFDVARIWILAPSVGQNARASLAGGGVGLRLRAAPQLVAEADLALPAKRTDRTPDHDARLHLRLRAQF